MIPPYHPRLQLRSTAQKAAWASYRALLVKAALKHNITIDPLLWNGIRNAWYDGYWTCYDHALSNLKNQNI